MKDITYSLFWKKGFRYIESDNLEDLEMLEGGLIKARRISRFILIENDNYKITNSDQAYILSPYTMKFVKIEPDAIKKGNYQSRKYLSRSIKNYMPQPYPPTIEIGTSTNCTRRCKSCIHYYKDIPTRYMNDITWQKIVEQLSEEYKKMEDSSKPTIHLHWYNEPLLDKKIELKLEDLKSKSVDNVVLITNGDLLSYNKALSLSEKVEFLIISSKSALVYSRFKHFNYTDLNIACIDHSIYSNSTRGFNRCSAVYEYYSEKPRRCDKDFNIQIDFDGEIYLCCNDMLKSKSVGNVNLNNMFHIWFSNEIQEMRKELFEGRFIGEPCKYCTFNFK